MAENVKWILDREPSGTKMMLWAHNGHVAAAAPPDAPADIPMGGHLRQIFGDEMVSCGFAFGQGSFRAVDMPTGQINTFTVSPAPRGSFDATLASLDIPLFAVDLRHAPEWFAAPHYSRQIGGGDAGRVDASNPRRARLRPADIRQQDHREPVSHSDNFQGAERCTRSDIES